MRETYYTVRNKWLVWRYRNKAKKALKTEQAVESIEGPLASSEEQPKKSQIKKTKAEKSARMNNVEKREEFKDDEECSPDILK